MSENLVRFGLSNVHYAIYDADTSSYGDPVAWPGAVSLSISPEGESKKFYADNIEYVILLLNNGYSGSLEMAAALDDASIALLGAVKDADGKVVETVNDSTVQFALMFEVTGNLREQRTVFYNCVLGRPSVNANTKSDSTDVDTVSYDIEIGSIEAELNGDTVHVVKATLENTTDTASAYTAFMDSVPLPTSTTA